MIIAHPVGIPSIVSFLPLTAYGRHLSSPRHGLYSKNRPPSPRGNKQFLGFLESRYLWNLQVSSIQLAAPPLSNLFPSGSSPRCRSLLSCGHFEACPLTSSDNMRHDPLVLPTALLRISPLTLLHRPISSFVFDLMSSPFRSFRLDRRQPLSLQNQLTDPAQKLSFPPSFQLGYVISDLALPRSFFLPAPRDHLHFC